MLILKEYLLSNVGDIRSKWKNVPYPYFLVNKENKIKYVNDLTNICDSWVSVLRKIMVKKKRVILKITIYQMTTTSILIYYFVIKSLQILSFYYIFFS